MLLSSIYYILFQWNLANTWYSVLWLSNPPNQAVNRFTIINHIITHIYKSRFKQYWLKASSEGIFSRDTWVTLATLGSDKTLPNKSSKEHITIQSFFGGGSQHQYLLLKCQWNNVLEPWSPKGGHLSRDTWVTFAALLVKLTISLLVIASFYLTLRE